jgi:protein TonB
MDASTAFTFGQRYQYNERLLWICVGGSMLVHALAVLWFRGVEPRDTSPQPLRATIRSEVRRAAPPPPVPVPQVATPEPPAPEPPKPAPPPEPPKALTKPAVPDKVAPKASEPAPKAAPKSAAPEAKAEPKPVPATASEAKAEPKQEEPKASTAPPAAASGASDAEIVALVRSYENQLAVAAQKFKRYPSEAMEQKWEGTARVKVHIGADGKIAGVDMVSSSGHDMLDEQARITINKAKPFVQIPAALRGKAFDAEIRVVFTLAKPAE